ncbi:MAG TPA: hypothetical protein VJW95_01325 [Dissulfurispiraceae bacterium]|nr:hypothetical protein [Dissulfurispiraceae bacterium]
MNAGIGGVSNIGGNIGGSSGITHTMTPVPKDPLNAMALNDINQKKHHKEWEMSFAAELSNLTKQTVSGVQSGTTGDTGTRINTYA